MLELIFKNTYSKQQSNTLTLSHYTLKKTGTLSLFIRIASVDNQLRMSGTVQMIWRILSPSVTLVSISTFSPKHKVLELTYNIYPDKKNHHSHYPRFNGFFTRGSSKLFLVKLETYRLKVDLTSSCHRLVQQAELCQCSCIARLTKYLWKIQNVNKNTTFSKNFSFNHLSLLLF